MTHQIEAYKEHIWLTITICRSGNYRGHQRSTGHKNLTLSDIKKGLKLHLILNKKWVKIESLECNLQIFFLQI